jgi:hypothetical protein
LSKYTAVDPWEKEDILRSTKIVLNPNKNQKKIFNTWFNTCDYLYNKTLEKIKNGSKINKINLRDELVTNRTKKTHPEYILKTTEILELHKKIKTVTDEKKQDIIKQEISKKNEELRIFAKTLKWEKNENITKRELKTPKEIRADTVIELCSNYRSAISNFKNGNIKNFDISYRKKNRESNCISLQKNLVSIIDSKIKICPNFLKKDSLFDIGKHTLKKLDIEEIVHTCRLKKEKGKYILCIPNKVKRVPKENIKKNRHQNKKSKK